MPVIFIRQSATVSFCLSGDKSKINVRFVVGSIIHGVLIIQAGYKEKSYFCWCQTHKSFLVCPLG